MTTTSRWRVHLSAHHQEKAQRVMQKLTAAMGGTAPDVQVRPYSKGGHVATFDLEHDTTSWPDVVLDVLSCAEDIGREWTLYGRVHEEIDAATTTSRFAGVEMAQVSCLNPTGTPPDSSGR